MGWKTDFRSLYYQGAPEPDDPVIVPAETAFLVIDVQNTYLDRPDRATLSGADLDRYDAWTPFHRRMRGQVIPRIAGALSALPRSRHRVPLRPHRLPQGLTDATVRSARSFRAGTTCCCRRTIPRRNWCPNWRRWVTRSS